MGTFQKRQQIREDLETLELYEHVEAGMVAICEKNHELLHAYSPFWGSWSARICTILLFKPCVTNISKDWGRAFGTTVWIHILRYPCYTQWRTTALNCAFRLWSPLPWTNCEWGESNSYCTDFSAKVKRAALSLVDCGIWLRWPRLHQRGRNENQIRVFVLNDGESKWRCRHRQMGTWTFFGSREPVSSIWTLHASDSVLEAGDVVVCCIRQID